MSNQYVPLFVAPQARDEPALWFAFRRAEILVVDGTGAPELPCCMDLSEHGLKPRRAQYLGLYGGRHAYAAEIPEEFRPTLYRRHGVRPILLFTVSRRLRCLGIVESGSCSTSACAKRSRSS